jgi:TetR/AcrR family transcriptional repressor of bet genes
VSRIVDSEQRRALVSAAVLQVLAERGLEGLSLRTVAGAAGCTTGMVLHYFTDRRELLLHARRLMHERMLGRVLAAQSSAPTPIAALREVLCQSLPLDAGRLAEARIWLGFLAAAMHDEQLAGEHAEHNRAWQDRLAAMVSAARPDLTPARARRKAQDLVALTDGMATLATVDPTSFSARRQRDLLDDALTDLSRPNS